MIGKITHGSDFGGLFRYLLGPDKEARIIGGKAFCKTASTLTQEFNNCADRRSRTKKPVKHFIIGFARSDGRVSDEVKERVARKAIERLGYTRNQYVVIDHGRDDPGHYGSHDHDHIHIVANMITFDARRVDDWQDKRRFEAILREIEIEEGLTIVAPSRQKTINAPSSGQVQRYKKEKELYEKGLSNNKPQAIVSNFVQQYINEFSRDRPTMSQFIARLRAMGIAIKAKITRNNKIQGISYGADGVWFPGYRLHHSSFPKLIEERKIDYSSDRDFESLINPLKSTDVLADSEKNNQSNNIDTLTAEAREILFQHC